jgi:hypothetical protein
MPHTDITDREEARGKGQPVEPAAGEGHAGTRAPARMRQIVAALTAVTQSARPRRVPGQRSAPAAAPKWEADGLEAALADNPRRVTVKPRTGQTAGLDDAAPTGLWWTGPEPPGRQWAAWWTRVQDADHGAVKVWLLVTGLALCLVGTTAAVLAWFTQHEGALALVAVVAAVLWGATLMDSAPVMQVGGAP